MLKRTNDPLVGACIDTMNSTATLEKPLETVKILSPYAVCTHLKDFRVERRSVSGFSIFGVPVGKGILDVKAVLDMLEEHGRNANVLLEQFIGMRGDEEETLKEEERWIEEGVGYMRSIMS